MATVQEFASKYPDFRKRIESTCVVDVGNAFTKTHSGIKFPSTIKEIINLNEETTDGYTTVVQYEGVTYHVGTQKAETNTDPDKYQETSYKILVLTALVEHFKQVAREQGKAVKSDLNVRLGLGLPAEYYTDHVDSLKEEFRKKEFDITIEEQSFKIKIIDVQVFKQGGTMSNDDAANFTYPMLIVDFGGGTLDASYWETMVNKRGRKEPRLTTTRSSEEYGFQQIMHELRTKVVSLTGSRINNYNLMEYLEEGPPHFMDSTEFEEIVDDILRPYAHNVYRSLYNSFNIVATKDIKLIGGPAKLLLPYFAEMVPVTTTVELMTETPQFVNANLFFHKYLYAQMVFYMKHVITNAARE